MERALNRKIAGRAALCRRLVDRRNHPAPSVPQARNRSGLPLAESGNASRTQPRCDAGGSSFSATAHGMTRRVGSTSCGTSPATMTVSLSLRAKTAFTGWRQPELDVVSGTNRVLAPIPGYERNGCTVWLDHDAADPAERFKMFAYFRRGTGSWPRGEAVPPPEEPEQSFIFTSPNGIHWARRARTGPCGDNTGMFYNPFRRMWTYSIRISDRQHGRTRSYYEHPDFLASV